jgi:hypothetical protein
VQVQGQAPVYALGDGSRAALEKPGKDLMDLNAFSFNTGDVERLEVQLGARKLAAVKKLGAWAWEEPAPEKGKAFDFDAFLTRLANTELLKRLDKKAKPAKLDKSVSLYGRDGSLLEKAEFGPRQGGTQIAVGAVKGQVVQVAGNLLDGLPEGK